SVSTFDIDSHGALTLAQAAAESVDGSHPTDMAVSPTSKRLFVLNTGTGNIASFAVGGMGKLLPLATVTVPLSAAGLVTE
ncbi:MAG TPA: beta-propeller fold lactonase family protein, partial [Burkholderiaceae bacterium]|nr:beta-propeller fold lactonase family protein [Burkholderiaceae bacterium]